MRKSRQRDAILRVVKNTTTHPAADWIYQQVRREVPNISLGTVYRNLNSLVETGQIVRLDMGGAATQYDGNCADHFHARCENCGTIIDVFIPVTHIINDKVTAATGFRITHCTLSARGLCPACLQESGSATKG